MTATDPSTNAHLVYVSQGCTDDTVQSQNLGGQCSCGNNGCPANPDLCVQSGGTTTIYTYGTGNHINNDNKPGPCDCVVTAATGCGTLPDTCLYCPSGQTCVNEVCTTSGGFCNSGNSVNCVTGSGEETLCNGNTGICILDLDGVTANCLIPGSCSVDLSPCSSDSDCQTNYVCIGQHCCGLPGLVCYPAGPNVPAESKRNKSLVDAPLRNL